MDTAEAVAGDFGVSKRTVQNAVKKERLAKNADAEGDSERAEAIRTGAMKPPANPDYDDLVYARKALGNLQSKVLGVANRRPNLRIDVVGLKKGANVVSTVVERAITKVRATRSATSRDTVVDQLGRPVPEELRAKFDASPACDAAIERLDEALHVVKSFAGQPGGEFVDVNRIRTQLEHVKSLLVSSRYYTDCPTCRGIVEANCPRCDGHGYVPTARKGVLSQEERVWLGLTC